MKAFVYLFLLCTIFPLLRPFDEMDAFWHIEMGRLMWQSGTAFVAEPLLVNDAPLSSASWLSQILYWKFYQLADLWGPKILNCIVFALAFFLVAIQGSQIRLKANLSQYAPALTSLLIGLSASASNNGIRPQNFALLCFAILYVCLQRQKKSWVYIVCLFLLGIVWQNLHPSLVLGILLTCFWLANIQSIVLAALLFYAQICTPDGFSIFAISSKNYFVSKDLLNISEWLPAFSEQLWPALSAFWLSIFITILLLLKSDVRISGRRMAAAALFLVLSILSARFSIYWIIIMTPIWRDLIQGMLVSGKVDEKVLSFFESNFAQNALGALLVSVLLITVTIVPAIKENIPVEAIKNLATKIPDGHIYHTRGLMGLVALYGSKNWTRHFTGRLWNIKAKQWAQYVREARGEVPLDQIISTYNPSAFILNSIENGKLVQLLLENSQYKLEAELDNYYFFTRSNVT